MPTRPMRVFLSALGIAFGTTAMIAVVGISSYLAKPGVVHAGPGWRWS